MMSVAVFPMRTLCDACSVEELVTRYRFPHAAPTAEKVRRQAEAKSKSANCDRSLVR